MKIDKNQNGIIPIALIVVGAVLVGGTATGLASNSARPGDLLYPMDQALEGVQSTLTFGDEAQAKMYAKLAQERMGEVNSLVNGNASADNLDQAVRNYSEDAGKAVEKAEQIDDSVKAEDMLSQLAEESMLQKDQVLGIMDVAGDETKDMLMNAVQTSEQNYERTMNQLSEQKRYEVQNKVEQQMKNMGEEDMLKVKQSTNSASPDENGNSEDAGNPDSGSQPVQPTDNGNQSDDTGSGSSGGNN